MTMVDGRHKENIMVNFPCSNCGEELIDNIDQAIVSLKILLDMEENTPESYTLTGACPNCKESYCFDGAMFSHYMDTKIDNALLDSDDRELLETNAVILTPEEQKHLDQLIKEEKFDEINEFLQDITED